MNLKVFCVSFINLLVALAVPAANASFFPSWVMSDNQNIIFPICLFLLILLSTFASVKKLYALDLKNFELAQVVLIKDEFLVIGCLVGVYSLELVPVPGILEFICLWCLHNQHTLDLSD